MAEFEFKCEFCKQTLEVSDDMAGEIVDCPNCQKSITIPRPPLRAVAPAPVAPAPAAPKPPVQQSRPQPPAKPAPAPAASAAKAPVCPECKSPMQPGAVLCMSCGFHTKLGKKIKTEFT